MRNGGMVNNAVKVFDELSKPKYSNNNIIVTITPTQLNNLFSTTKNPRHVTQLHTQILTNNFISLPFLFNNLINTYGKFGHIDKTLTLFHSTKFEECKNVITWTSLVTQLTRFNKPFKALTFFDQMRCSGVYPNEFTFSAVLSACAELTVVSNGGQVHCLIWKHGFVSDLFVGSGLVDMYGKCFSLAFARKVFEEMPVRNVVSWNAVIVGSLRNKVYEGAVGFFVRVVREEMVGPDEVSFSSVLSACGNMGELGFGRQVHGVVSKNGFVMRNYVKNSLLDMYCKCGSFEDSVKLFRMLEDRDVVSWNVMIMGCVQNSNFKEACNYFWSMRSEGISADKASFSTVLLASASLSTLNQGSLVHGQIVRTGFGSNVCVANSLITMYSKCGQLDNAYKVFKETDNINVVCWTAMITAFQQHGNSKEVLELFEEMLGKGIQPDYITFISVLSACSHSGRVEEGFAYFDSMTRTHDIKPGHEHYACMVDLLGRAGRLGEANKFIESMPIKPDSTVWGALLGACCNYGNMEMGKEVAQRLFELEPENPGNYVLLSNMYMQKGMLKEADEVRRLMGISGIRKEPGCSWIDVKNSTFVFTAHDRSHAKTKEIYELLRKVEELVKKKGYVAETKYAVNSEEGHKERSLWYHSEKLALAFGLLTLPAGAPITIKKNLRTCGDCHTVMKFASEIFRREIIVRDILRFHRFANGSCSCGDYW